MKTMSRLKQTCLATGKSCGLFSVASSSRFRNARSLVLGYHGISLVDEDLWNPSLYLSVDTFRRRMYLLRSCCCTVLSLEESLDLTRLGKLPDRTVVLTFDDGTYDFYGAVWPILKEFGYPATLYLNTYYVDNQFPCTPGIWSYMLWKARTLKVNAGEILGQDCIFNLTEESGRSEALRQIVSVGNPDQMDARRRNDLSEKLAHILGLDFETLRDSRIHQLLRPEEVRELARDGVSVQMHMHKHKSPPTREAYIENLEINRQRITTMTGSTPRHFCYPSGRYSQERVNWLRDCAISSATTCHPGLFSARTEPLLIPRLIDSSNVSDTTFESWLAGIGVLLSNCGAWLHRAIDVPVKIMSLRRAA